MKNNCLAKVVFNEHLDLHNSNTDTSFNCFESIKKLFEELGVDHMFNGDFSLRRFKEHVAHNNLTSFAQDVEDQTSQDYIV